MNVKKKVAHNAAKLALVALEIARHDNFFSISQDDDVGSNSLGYREAMKKLLPVIKELDMSVYDAGEIETLAKNASI